MNMLYLHKPNYYFFAHKLALFLTDYVKTHPSEQHTSFNLHTIYNLFSHDLASSTTNLEGILNIVDEYKLDTEEGLQPLLTTHSVSLSNHVLNLDFNHKAMQSLNAGKALLSPKMI